MNRRKLFTVMKEKFKNSIGLQYVFQLAAALSLSVFLSKTFWLQHGSLIHAAFESVCIFIALSTFIIVFLTYEVSNTSSRMIGFGFLAVGAFDFLHTYYFPGLPFYAGGYGDISTSYWLLGQLAEAVVLLFGMMNGVRVKINKWIALLITCAVVASVTTGVQSLYFLRPVLPAWKGITASGALAEYFVIFIFLAGLYYLHKDAAKKDALIYKYICLAILLSIPAGLCFVLFTEAASFCNILGHILKILGYAYLFRGIFIRMVICPYERLKEINDELGDSRNELKEILNGLPLGLMNYDNNNRVSFVNGKALELLECTAQEVMGLTKEETSEKFLVRGPKREERNKKGGTNGEEVYSPVKSCRTLKGNIIKLNVSVFRYKSGFLLSFQDARKDQELSDLKIQTWTILDSVNNMVLIVDRDKKIITANKAFLECVEMEAGDVLGKEWKVFSKTIQLVYKSQNTSYSECFSEATLVTAKGSKKDIFFHAGPIVNVEQEIMGHIGVASDITQYKKELQIVQQQEKLAMIGQMGSGIVHETKNHLASIKGYCQLLALKIQDESLKNYVRRIDSITEDVNKVIVDFLTLAKPTDTMMERVSVKELVEDMRYMLESPSFMKGVDIHISLSGDERDVIADETQIKQVILNITKNAIEAMQDTETPVLSIRTQRCDPDRCMEIIISDNGKGIPGNILNKLGTPFFTTKETGTGLGLSVCYRIVEEHRGHIRVQSEEGRGATFVVSIPWAEEAVPDFSAADL